MSRVYNFSAGPSTIAEEVLQRAQDELLEWGKSGMSVMEMSHRGKDYVGIAEKAEADFREILGVPDNYKVLFVSGGATGQFAAIPMNLLRKKSVRSIIFSETVVVVTTICPTMLAFVPTP